MSTNRYISTLGSDALRSDRPGSAFRDPGDSTDRKELEKAYVPVNNNGGKVGEDPDNALLLEANQKLSRENEELRRCIALLRENCELKSATVMSFLMSMCDDRLRRFMLETFMSGPSTPPNQSKDTKRDSSPSYGCSFNTVGYSEIAGSTDQEVTGGSYLAPRVESKRASADTDSFKRSTPSGQGTKGRAARFNADQTSNIDTFPELKLDELAESTGTRPASSNERKGLPKESGRLTNPRQTWRDATASLKNVPNTTRQSKTPSIKQPPMKFSKNPKPLTASELNKKYSPGDRPKRPTSPNLREKQAQDASGRRSQKSTLQDSDAAESSPNDMTRDSLESGPNSDRNDVRKPVLDGRLIFQRKLQTRTGQMDYGDKDEATRRSPTQLSNYSETRGEVNQLILNERPDDATVSDKRDQISMNREIRTDSTNIEQFRANQQSTQESIDPYYDNDGVQSPFYSVDQQANENVRTRTTSDAMRSLNTQNQTATPLFNSRGPPVRERTTMDWEGGNEDVTLTKYGQSYDQPSRQRQEPSRQENVSNDQRYYDSIDSQRSDERRSNKSAGRRYNEGTRDRNALSDDVFAANQTGTTGREFETPQASSTPVATRNPRYMNDPEAVDTDSSRPYVTATSGNTRMTSFSSGRATTPDPGPSREPVPLTGSRSYEMLGRPVAQSTPQAKRGDPRDRSLDDTISNKTLAQIIGFQGNGAAEKADFVLRRPVDSLIEYSPNITQDIAVALAKSTPTRRFVGEISFQLDRRILEYVFAGVWSDPQRKKSRFYGYSLVNIIPMIQKELQAEGVDSKRLEDTLLTRLENIIDSIKRFGYSFKTHAQFTQKMVNTYGLLNTPPDVSTVEAFGLDDPGVLRVLIGQILKDDSQLHHMLIILDCLCFLAYEDKRPLFMW